MQAAGSHAIGASLVFLDLLKGQADCLPELFLAQAKHVPAQPHAGTDVDIDRVRLVALLATRPSRLLVHRHLWPVAGGTAARPSAEPECDRERAEQKLRPGLTRALHTELVSGHEGALLRSQWGREKCRRRETEA